MLHWLALIPAPSSTTSTETVRASQQRALGWWALQFTPRVCLQEDAVLLEIAASELLFGGATALRARIRHEAGALGCGTIAWAPTGLGALALARAGMCDGFARALQRLLDPLPLDVSSRVAVEQPLLSRLGCRTLGDVRRLPRAGLSRRCAPDLLIALDQIYGDRPECHEWLELPDVFEARLELPGRAESVAELMHGARHLLIQMAGWLAARHAGVRHFTLRWLHDGQRARAVGPGGELTVRTAEATRDVEHLARLLSEQLMRMGLAAAVGDLLLHAAEIEPVMADSASLLLDPSQKREPLHRLLERLAARLGPERVRCPRLVSDHRLEWMQSWHPATEAPPPGKPVPVSNIPQPSWILMQPLQLAVHHEKPIHQGPLQILTGPHRIEAGWWDRPRQSDGNAVTRDIARDYYVALSAQAGLLWIYRQRMARDEKDGNWFLQGVFA